jgi:hypothetical protein
LAKTLLIVPISPGPRSDVGHRWTRWRAWAAYSSDAPRGGGGRAPYGASDAQAVRGPQQGSLVSLASRHFGNDFAPEQDNRTVANQAYFWELGCEQEHGRARIGKLSQEPINLMLGADINAACRIKAKQGLKAGGNPSRNDHLLLIAAAQPSQLGARAGVNL